VPAGIPSTRHEPFAAIDARRVVPSALERDRRALGLHVADGARERRLERVDVTDLRRDRLPVARRGRELELLRGVESGLVEAVTAVLGDRRVRDAPAPSRSSTSITSTVTVTLSLTACSDIARPRPSRDAAR